MAKTITVTGVRINMIRIERDAENNITLTTDYSWLDANGVIPGINLQVSREDAPLASLPTNVRNGLIAINDYIQARIIAAEGI